MNMREIRAANNRVFSGKKPAKPSKGTGQNICAVIRAMLNCNGFEWKQCEEIVEGIKPLLHEASWLELDDGTTFDLSFKPSK
jgi:hypothetical protein